MHLSPSALRVAGILPMACTVANPARQHESFGAREHTLEATTRMQLDPEAICQGVLSCVHPVALWSRHSHNRFSGYALSSGRPAFLYPQPRTLAPCYHVSPVLMFSTLAFVSVVMLAYVSQIYPITHMSVVYTCP